MEICHAHSKASNENVSLACRGDYDAEYMNTALAVEKLFLKRGWTAPLPKPEKINYYEENKPENGCAKCHCPKYAHHGKSVGCEGCINHNGYLCCDGEYEPIVKPDFSNTSDDNWYPASDGTEEPFISRSGKRLLYCYQPSTRNHAYLDVDCDIILTDEESRQYLQTY